MSMSIMYQTVFVLCNKIMSKQTKDRAYKVVDAYEDENENEHAWGTNNNDDGGEDNDGDEMRHDEVLTENRKVKDGEHSRKD